MQTEVDNSWHEKGELPPVGTICETNTLSKGWLCCEILKHSESSLKVAACYLPKDDWQLRLIWGGEFRPIKSDRTKAIEAVVSEIREGYESNLIRNLAGKLFDAGLLRLPEDK